MEKKCFFFDIDGTLTIKETGEVPLSVKETIKKLKEKGHFVCIASGRAYYKVKDLAREMGIDYVVANGGAALADHGKLVENEPLDREKALALCKQAKELGCGVLVAFDDSIKVMMNDHQFIEQVGKRQEPTEYIYDPKLSFDKLENIYKVYVAISQEDEPLLTTRKELGYLRFVPSYLTFQHDKKDQGIKKMIDYIGGRDDQVVVFGDDTNDIIMFKDEWTKIAMGNACSSLKDKADFITKENKDDGIAYACQYFGWIDKEEEI